MTTPRIHRRNCFRFALFATATMLAVGGLAGCLQPNYSAVADRLRQQTMDQEKQIDSLKDQLNNARATLQTLRERTAAGAPPLQTLSTDRLNDLFTASSMEIRKETRTDSWDENGKTVTGFRVFIRFTTKDGEYLPASGTMTIEAFELPPAPADPRRIGAWTFTPQYMKKHWYSGLGLNHFAFNCPFTQPPTMREINFKARFIDALTGQTLEARLTRFIDPPVATTP